MGVCVGVFPLCGVTAGDYNTITALDCAITARAVQVNNDAIRSRPLGHRDLTLNGTSNPSVRLTAHRSPGVHGGVEWRRDPFTRGDVHVFTAKAALRSAAGHEAVCTPLPVTVFKRSGQDPASNDV